MEKINEMQGAISYETKNVVETMKEKYGKIYCITTTLVPDDETEIEKTYTFRQPTALSFDRYMKGASTGAMKAMRTFIVDNIVAEDMDKLTLDLEDYPALALSIGEKLLAMLGMTKEINLKRL